MAAGLRNGSTCKALGLNHLMRNPSHADIDVVEKREERMMKFYTFDGTQKVPITKAEIRSWVKRIREDLRDYEASLKDNDLDGMHDYAYDVAGAASALQDISDATEGTVQRMV